MCTTSFFYIICDVTVGKTVSFPSFSQTKRRMFPFCSCFKQTFLLYLSVFLYFLNILVVFGLFWKYWSVPSPTEILWMNYPIKMIIRAWSFIWETQFLSFDWQERRRRSLCASRLVGDFYQFFIICPSSFHEWTFQGRGSESFYAYTKF